MITKAEFHGKIDMDDMSFMKQYKDQHGVSVQKFIEQAVKEKIINVKAEIALKSK